MAVIFVKKKKKKLCAIRCAQEAGQMWPELIKIRLV